MFRRGFFGVFIEFLVKEYYGSFYAFCWDPDLLWVKPREVDLFPSYSSKTNLVNSSGHILVCWSISNVLNKKLVDDWLMFLGSNFFIGIEVSILPNYFSVLAFHGVLPVSIS